MQKNKREQRNRSMFWGTLKWLLLDKYVVKQFPSKIGSLDLKWTMTKGLNWLRMNFRSFYKSFFFFTFLRCLPYIPRMWWLRSEHHWTCRRRLCMGWSRFVLKKNWSSVIAELDLYKLEAEADTMQRGSLVINLSLEMYIRTCHLSLEGQIIHNCHLSFAYSNTDVSVIVA